MVNALNSFDGPKPIYEKILRTRGACDIGRRNVSIVQERVIGYVERRSKLACHRGYVSRETTTCTMVDTYALQVDLDKEPIPLDPSGKKIGLPERVKAAPVPILDVLSVHMQEYYASGGFRKPQQGLS